MHLFTEDIRHALRQFGRSPSFAVLALITLTLGVAANVIVFGVIDAMFLRPLSGISQPHELYTVQHDEDIWNSLSYPDYKDIRDRNRVFSDVAMYRPARIGLGQSQSAQPVWGYEVSGNYFDMLGVKPALGHFFHAEDDVNPGGKQYAVLSYRAWQERFASDPAVVGTTIYLNKYPFTLVGIAPERFRGTEQLISPEVWVPITNVVLIEGYNWTLNRNDSNAWVIARVKPGVTKAQARANLNAIAAQLGREYPNNDEGLKLRLTKPGFMGDALGIPARGFTLAIMLLALLVLLAASANLGGLFAARTADRARELAIRIAVGSSRLRIFRQLVTESVLISLLGGIAAMFVARAALQLLSQWHPPTEFPIQFAVDPDLSVYAFALLVALVTGVLLGLLPARQVWNTDPNHALRSAGSSPLVSRRWALRDLLLGVQIALCCLLVTASLVSLRGLVRAFRMPLGFDRQDVTLAMFDLHLARYADDKLPLAQQQLLERVSGLPGVTAAAYSSSTPLSLDQSETDVYPPGVHDFRPTNVQFNANYYSVSPGYFHAAGTRIVAGREFSWADNKDAPEVAVINETFARRLFGNDSPIGKYFNTGMSHRLQVVGVVEDGKYAFLAEGPSPALFFPILQAKNSSTVLLVRSPRPPSEMVPAVREVISEFDPSIAVFGVRSWTDALAIALFPARAATIALGIFGLLALMLAITGIFGLASYTVSKRLRELGIRVALGAHTQDVMRAALGRTIVLLIGGSVAGLFLGIVATRVLAMIVYQASALDPVVLLGVLATMTLVGVISASLPARRALTVNPSKLLREE
jgi:predicted permease